MQAHRLMLLLLTMEFAEMLMAFGVGGGARYLYWGDVTFDWSMLLKALLMAVVVQFCFYSNDLYATKEVYNNATLFRRFVVALTVAAVALTVIFFLLPSIAVGRVIFALTLIAFTIFFFLGRLTVVRHLGERWMRKRYLIMGTGQFARDLGQVVLARAALGYELVGFLSKEPQRAGEPFLNPGIVGGYNDVEAVCKANHIDEIIIAVGNRRGNMPMEQLLELKFRGTTITDGMTFYEREHDKVYVRQLNSSWLVFNQNFNISPLTLNAKRGLDIVLSLTGLVLASPLMLGAAVAVKLTSRGPIIYSQERAGRFGKPFMIHKFRSMSAGAEKGTPRFAEENDPRVTAVGGFMRKTRIDELPQMINILKGDMSLVGPRPERPYFIERLREKAPFFHHRLQVKPGLTGLAQISYGYSGSDDEDHLQKLQYDLSYIKNLSVALDLAIIAKTVKVVIIGKGAR